jgi:hypothetical protein
LFCRTAGPLAVETEAIGAMLATHAAIALMADSSAHQFQSALASK